MANCCRYELLIQFVEHKSQIKLHLQIVNLQITANCYDSFLLIRNA